MVETVENKAAEQPAEARFRVEHYHWREIFRRFSPLLAPYRFRMSVTALLLMLVGAAFAAVPLFPKYVIDTAIRTHGRGEGICYALAAAAVFLVVECGRTVLWYFAMSNVYLIQQSVVFKLRAESFSHLQRLCLSFHSKFPSGFLYERVFGNSINALGTFIQTFMQQFATFVTGLFFSLFVCLYLSWQLTLVIIAGAACYVYVARRLSQRIYAKSRESAQAGMRVTEVIMDKLHGHKTIQAFIMEDQVQREFESEIWTAQRKWLSSVMESMKLSLTTENISYFLTATVVVTGAYMVLDENMEIGTLVAFVGYQATLITVIQSLTNVYGQFTTTRVAFDQLFTVLDTHSDIEEQPGAEMVPAVEGGLELRHVDFGYEPGQLILKDANLVIPPRQTVALVGRSGCGKTTVTNLLMRFYDPERGEVLLDGRDIRTLPLHDYRALFGVVLQDPYLFDTTIFENLHCANPEADEEAIVEALKKARAWEFVEKLPGQLQFRVGERGGRLSGGQRQRLAIARCMLLRSRIVLLDEATSALDPESEALIQQSFDALSHHKTVLIIAHRLNTLRHVDRIIVMDRGSVAESGSYEELLAKGGLFAELHSIATAGMIREARMAEAGFA
ncbi:MAG: ABC transporter ATP-binding protein [Lentisphaeria bacterium]|nr:ABC transporter ATP-binding protein [Lentisphaeria bacterium]